MHDSVPAQFKSLATITTIVMRRFVLCYSPQLVAPSGAAIDGSRSSYQGFNVEAVEYKNISFTVWDVGGQDKNREQFTEQGNAIAFESKVNKIYLRIPNIIANEEQHSLSIAEMEGTLITRKVPQIQTRMYE